MRFFFVSIPRLAMILSAAFVTVAHGQINKCNVGGKIVYQQESCGKGGSTGEEIKVVVPSTTDGFAASPDLDRLRDDYLKAKRVLDETTAKYCADKKFDIPAFGMSEADLRCIKRYRQPDKINVTTTALDERKQYIFRDQEAVTYIYFRNGRLETIQTHQ